MGACNVCDCDPCDCHGVNDEFRFMGTAGATKTRQKSKLVSWQDRLASFSLMQMEIGLIEPKNRVFLPRMQRDLPAEERTDRENDKRGSERNGD